MITNSKNTPAILISAPNSGSGKTIITSIILNALIKKGLKICAYKTGCDYLDTKILKFHSKSEVYNLDTWLMNKESVLELFKKTSTGKDIAVIEGAMGLYDGGKFSSSEIAKLLKVPVILVMNVKSMGESAAALALGFKNYDSEIKIAGVILNCVGSESHGKLISKVLYEKGIEILGILKRSEDLKIPSRHLGLIPLNENENTESLNKFENCINIDEILKIAYSNTEKILSENSQQRHNKIHKSKKISLGIAYDEAFSFYYSESLEALKNHGIDLKFFSPIRDSKIPEANGYFFGGGYPEIYAEELSGNITFKNEIKKAYESGKIIFAECGGFMYLSNTIENLKGEKFQMTGIIKSDSIMSERPVIGYVEAKALKKNFLCSEGSIIRGHEFHFSRMITDFKFENNAFEITRRSTGDIWYGGFSEKNILASYLHINFWGNENLIENFKNALQN